MAEVPPPRPIAAVTHELTALGVEAGDTLMVHASLRAVGPVAGGADGLLEALESAVGAAGTLLMLLGADGRVTPFDALTTPADPEVGVLAEVLRRRPGTQVTDHPEGRFGARGARAAPLLADPPWDDYFGPGSPLDRLRLAGGRVLRLGADDNTVTLLHYAEYVVPLEGKRRVCREHLVRAPSGITRRAVESLDNSEGIVDWPDEDYFGLILTEYLATGRALRGHVGGAPSELFDGRDLVDFGVRWMMRAFGGARSGHPKTSPDGG